MIFLGRAAGHHTVRDPGVGLGHCRAVARRPETRAHLLVAMVVPVIAGAGAEAGATTETIAEPGASAVDVVGLAVRAH